MDTVLMGFASVRKGGRELIAVRQTMMHFNACQIVQDMGNLMLKLKLVPVSPCGQARTAPEVRGESIL
jgi:hypothetical protein